MYKHTHTLRNKHTEVGRVSSRVNRLSADLSTTVTMGSLATGSASSEVRGSSLYLRSLCQCFNVKKKNKTWSSALLLVSVLSLSYITHSYNPSEPKLKVDTVDRSPHCC